MAGHTGNHLGLMRPTITAAIDGTDHLGYKAATFAT
jgi:hypothetical protein